MNPQAPTTFERYLAVDLHKDYVVIGGVNARQEVVLPPRRMTLDAWPTWAKKNLKPTDALVVEATTNAWDFFDEVLPLVGRAVVANANKVKLIAAAKVKTDKVDVLALGRLLAADFTRAQHALGAGIPEVWVPPVVVRELRALLAHRQQLVKNQTMLKNRLHSVLHRHHLVPPEGNPFLPAQQAWWEALPVSPTEQLHLRHDWATLAQLAPQLAEVEAELERLSTVSPWAEQVLYLLQLPGCGLIISMTLLAAIGDITRFEEAKHLVGYAGLGTAVYDSGHTHRTGHITKAGRRDLRWAAIEAAWRAVDCHAHWKQEYERLTRRMEPNKAIVVIAHKLLIAVWHVLTERAADTHADPQMVATKFMRWSWELTDEQRGGLTTRQFIRTQLMKLQLGEDLTHIRYGNKPRRIASVEDLLAAKPERNPSG